MHECIRGFISAARLLGDITKNKASEYDLRQLEQYEERLKQLGFGNPHDVQGTSSDDQLTPELGDVTRNLISELMTKAQRRERGNKEILYEYDELLCLAGFGEHYDADKMAALEHLIKLCVPNLFGETSSGLLTLPLETSNEIADFPEEASRKSEIRQQTSSNVGILTAVNLLYELGMGLVCDDGLRKLEEYEGRLKETRNAVKSNQCPPGLGITTNNILTKLAEQLADTDDREEKSFIIELYEDLFQMVGFGGHYDAAKIEELQEDLDNLRMAFKGNLDEV